MKILFKHKTIFFGIKDGKLDSMDFYNIDPHIILDDVPDLKDSKPLYEITYRYVDNFGSSCKDVAIVYFEHKNLMIVCGKRGGEVWELVDGCTKDYTIANFSIIDNL